MRINCVSIMCVIALVMMCAGCNLLIHNKNTELGVAASTGDIEYAQKLIAKGASVNYIPKTGDNMTPLNRACFSGQAKMAVYLLRNGADPNIPTRSGMAPLDYVIACIQSGGNEDEYADLIELLISKGANTKPLWRYRMLRDMNPRLNNIINKYYPKT